MSRLIFHAGQRVMPMDATTVLFTPDGRGILTLTTGEKAVILRDALSGKKRHVYQNEERLSSCLSMTPDGKYVIAMRCIFSENRSVVVWHVSGRKNKYEITCTDSIFCCSSKPTNSHLVLGTSWGQVQVHRITNGELVICLSSTERVINSVAITRNDQYIVAGSDDNRACVWRLNGGALTHDIRLQSSVQTVDATPDNAHFVTGCLNGLICIFGLLEGQCICSFNNTHPVFHMDISTDGRWLMSCNLNAVQIWNLQKTDAKPLMFDHKYASSVAFHPNGKQFAVSSSSLAACVFTFCEWSDRDHQLFGPEFKALVFYLMCVKARLDDFYYSQKRSVLPRLPMAVWLQVIAFLV